MATPGINKNGFQSWRTAIGDVNDAGRWLVKSGIADPSKLAIVGWSYGGYAALQTSVLDPDLFKAIVAIAPVTDLETLRNEANRLSPISRSVDARSVDGPWVVEGSPARNADADQGAGAAVPRRPRPECRDRRIAADGRQAEGRGRQGRTGRVQGARPPARRQRGARATCSPRPTRSCARRWGCRPSAQTKKGGPGGTALFFHARRGKAASSDLA